MGRKGLTHRQRGEEMIAKILFDAKSSYQSHHSLKTHKSSRQAFYQDQFENACIYMYTAVLGKIHLPILEKRESLVCKIAPQIYASLNMNIL